MQATIGILLLCLTATSGIHILPRKNTSLEWLLRNQSTQTNSTNPYCSICCIDVRQIYRGRICGIHTMCAYEKRPIGPACKGLIVMEFSRNEVDAIVNAHNILRNRVALGLESEGDPGPQPPAANMRLMQWNEELAAVALRWATQCVYAHDRCRDLQQFPVGQNIGRSTYASKSDWEHIENWYRWVKFTNSQVISSFDGSQVDLLPYTQLVWGDSYLVGCARVSFQQAKRGQIFYVEHFVCNYGPAGNIPQQSVYKIGEPCSGCVDGTYCTNPEYPGLCGSEYLNETDFLKRKAHKKVEVINAGGQLKVSLMLLVINVLFRFITSTT